MADSKTALQASSHTTTPTPPTPPTPSPSGGTAPALRGRYLRRNETHREARLRIEEQERAMVARGIALNDPAFTDAYTNHLRTMDKQIAADPVGASKAHEQLREALASPEVFDALITKTSKDLPNHVQVVAQKKALDDAALARMERKDRSEFVRAAIGTDLLNDRPLDMLQTDVKGTAWFVYYEPQVTRQVLLDVEALQAGVKAGSVDLSMDKSKELHATRNRIACYSKSQGRVVLLAPDASKLGKWTHLYYYAQSSLEEAVRVMKALGGLDRDPFPSSGGDIGQFTTVSV